MVAREKRSHQEKAGDVGKMVEKRKVDAPKALYRWSLHFRAVSELQLLVGRVVL